MSTCQVTVAYGNGYHFRHCGKLAKFTIKESPTFGGKKNLCACGIHAGKAKRRGLIVEEIKS